MYLLEISKEQLQIIPYSDRKKSLVLSQFRTEK